MKIRFNHFVNLLPSAFAIMAIMSCGSNTLPTTDETTRINDTTKKAIELPVMLTYRSESYLKLHGLIDTVMPQLDHVTPKISHFEAKQIILGCTASLTLNGKTITQLADSIERKDLMTFKGYAYALTCSQCTDSLAGMRIIFGQEGSALFLYYQPVLLCSSGEPRLDANNKKVRDFNLCNEADIYYYYNRNFEKVDNATEIADKNARINRYAKNPGGAQPHGVQIKNPLTGNPEAFKARANNDDGTANVVQVVYPIDRMIDLAEVFGATGRVKLWNALVKIDFDGVLYHKHNIELSTQDVDTIGTEVDIPSNALFSNLSHICPPRCSGNRFTFHIVE